MKNIFKSTLLLVMGMGLLSACNDDNDENPTLKTPTTFVLNKPVLADQPIDLANSSKLEIKCSQPDYGFPASTQYKVEVAFDEAMTNAVELSDSWTSATIGIDAATLASTLTTMQVEQNGKTEADFPMDIPVYMRVKANMITSDNSIVEGTAITSNVVSFSKIHLLYSLAPVTAPDDIYITGKFCGWTWDNCFTMLHNYGVDNVYWRMVYIDEEGVKFNSAKAWDGNEVGFEGINVGGDLADEIKGNGGNIASSNPGWYLMIVTATVEGRKIIYDVKFNKPEVWLIGPCTGVPDWTEKLEGWSCTVPTTVDGEFVSPAFAGACPGGDGDGVRAYVLIDEGNWWHSEFMVFDGKIVYREQGGDQDRVAGKVGQQLHLNFATGEGSIK